jgi:hypothetical protein
MWWWSPWLKRRHAGATPLYFAMVDFYRFVRLFVWTMKVWYVCPVMVKARVPEAPSLDEEVVVDGGDVCTHDYTGPSSHMAMGSRCLQRSVLL